MADHFVKLGEVLQAQNPWWREREARSARNYPYRRREFRLIEERMSSGARRARLVLGPRAVGKTVLLKQWMDSLLDSGVPGRQIIFADFDDPRMPAGATLQDVWEAPSKLGLSQPEGQQRYFVIDEVHESAGSWSHWLRRLVDRTQDRYLVTDSASALLSRGTVETGQARFDEIHVGSFDFRDFYFLETAPDLNALAGGDIELDSLKAPQVVAKYLVRGGFPGQIPLPDQAEAMRLLREDISEKAIVKDLGRRTRGDVGFLRDFFTALVERSGDTFVSQNWAEELGRQATRQRISRAIRLLEATFLVKALPRYASARRKQIGSHPRIYATDPGVVSAFSRHADPTGDPDTLGRLVETTVFSHLERRARVENVALSFYRQGDRLECDFVLASGRSLLLIECTASKGMDRKKAKTISQVAARLKGVKRAFCVSRSSAELKHEVGTVEIHEVPLWLFLDRLARKPLLELFP